MSQARNIRVSDPNFDGEGFGKQFQHAINEHLITHYLPPAIAIDQQHALQKAHSTPNQVEVNQVKLDMDSMWNPTWAQLTGVFGFTTLFHKHAIKQDVANIIHPMIRRAATPIALTIAGLSAANAYYNTRRAYFDDRTARFQAAANLTWSFAAFYALPSLVMKTVSSFGRRTSRYHFVRTYTGAAIALGLSFKYQQDIKDYIEGVFMRRRFNRKDYGSHGQSLETTSLRDDSELNRFEQQWNNNGNEYIISSDNEVELTNTFPMFMLAEALPTHEVPYHSKEYQNPVPLPFHTALLQGTIDLARSTTRDVPVPTVDTFRRYTDLWGEWSLASPAQLAMDSQLLHTKRGLSAFSLLLAAPWTTIDPELPEQDTAKVLESLEVYKDNYGLDVTTPFNFQKYGLTPQQFTLFALYVAQHKDDDLVDYSLGDRIALVNIAKRGAQVLEQYEQDVKKASASVV